MIATREGFYNVTESRVLVNAQIVTSIFGTVTRSVVSLKLVMHARKHLEVCLSQNIPMVVQQILIVIRGLDIVTVDLCLNKIWTIQGVR